MFPTDSAVKAKMAFMFPTVDHNVVFSDSLTLEKAVP